MFRPQRHLSGLLMLLALVGLHIFATEALAQKVRETFVYAPPMVSLAADQSVIKTCEGDMTPAVVHLNASATSLGGNNIRYRWTTSAGRIDGDGSSVIWDLAGVKPGSYNASLAISMGSAEETCEAFVNTAVLVKCPPLPPPVCPSVNISCPDRVTPGQPVTFGAALTGGSGNVTPVYNWTVSAGKIIEGQGTNSIKVDTTGLAGQSITATLSMGGYDLDCSATCSLHFPAPLTCRKFDEYSGISRNDEKARLDNFAIELQNDPTSTGHVIINPKQGGRPGQVQTQTKGIVDYLVNSRGLDARRVVTVVGPARSDQMVELRVCPQGAAPPKAGP